MSPPLRVFLSRHAAARPNSLGLLHTDALPTHATLLHRFRHVLNGRVALRPVPPTHAALLHRLRIGAAALALALVAPGCARSYSWQGADPSTAEPLSLEAGELPGPRSWAGTWHSPQLGTLELHQVGDAVTGRYSHPVGRCTVQGALHGEARGDLLLLRWWEDHRSCGREARLSGKGYFLWRPHPKRAGVHRLFGRFGYGWSDRAAGAWIAVRAE